MLSNPEQSASPLSLSLSQTGVGVGAGRTGAEEPWPASSHQNVTQTSQVFVWELGRTNRTSHRHALMCVSVCVCLSVCPFILKLGLFCFVLFCFCVFCFDFSFGFVL